MSTATPVIKPEDLSVDQIFTDEDWQDILDRILYINLDTAGVDMVDIILRQIENALRRMDDDDGVKNIFTRLAAQNNKFGKILPELERLYDFESTDQAGNSNRQNPDGVWQITLWGHEMWLFAEIDGNDKGKEPKKTAQKMWQDVILGRIHSDECSVATVRLNLDCVQNKGDVLQKKNIDEAFVLSKIKDLVVAATWTIAEWITYNCRNRSRKTNITSQLKQYMDDDTIQYDMHFFIGEFDMAVPRTLNHPAILPDNEPPAADIQIMRNNQNKRVRFAGSEAARERNNFAVSKMKDVFGQRYIRDCSSFQHRLNGEFHQYAACLNLTCDCQLRKGQIAGHGATVHYIFVPRVKQKDIDRAIQQIQTLVVNKTAQGILVTNQEIQSKLLPIMQKEVKGMWYLQDIYDFLTKIRSQWGNKWLVLLKPIFDAGNDVNPAKRIDGNTNQATNTMSVHDPNYWGAGLNPSVDQLKRRKYFWPPLFLHQENIKWTGANGIQSSNGNSDEYYLVYDYIIEPWMAAMVNMHQAIVNQTKWHRSPATHINYFNKKISKFKRMYFRHQLGLQNRASLNKIQPMVQSGNLRDSLLKVFDESQKSAEDYLDSELQKYLNEHFKHNCNLVFCRLVQCPNKLALHQLATQYMNGNARIDATLLQFSVGNSSEIQFMLKAIARDVKILLPVPTHETQEDPVIYSQTKRDMNLLIVLMYDHDNVQESYGNEYDELAVDLSSTFNINIENIPTAMTIAGFCQQLRFMAHRFKFTTQIDYFNARQREHTEDNVIERDKQLLYWVQDPSTFAAEEPVDTGTTPTWTGATFQSQILQRTKEIMDRQNKMADEKHLLNDVYEAFSVSLNSEHSTINPVMYYAKMYHVIRTIALAALTNPAHRRVWCLQQEPLPSDPSHTIYEDSGDKTARYYTLGTTPEEKEVRYSQELIRGMMYYECLQLCVQSDAVTGVNDKMTQLFHIVLNDMETLNTDIVHVTQTIEDAQFKTIATFLDSECKPFEFHTYSAFDSKDALEVPTDNVYDKLNLSKGPRCEGVAFHEQVYSDGTSDDNDTLRKKIRDNFPKFVTLLQTHFNIMMAEIEAVIKAHLLVIMFDDRSEGLFDMQTYDNGVKPSDSVSQNNWQLTQKADWDTTDSLLAIRNCNYPVTTTAYNTSDIQSLSGLKPFKNRSTQMRHNFISLDKCIHQRSVLIPQSEEIYLYNSFVSLRDFGMLRQTKFRNHIWVHKERTTKDSLHPDHIMRDYKNALYMTLKQSESSDDVYDSVVVEIDRKTDIPRIFDHDGVTLVAWKQQRKSTSHSVSDFKFTRSIIQPLISSTQAKQNIRTYDPDNWNPIDSGQIYIWVEGEDLQAVRKWLMGDPTFQMPVYKDEFKMRYNNKPNDDASWNLVIDPANNAYTNVYESTGPYEILQSRIQNIDHAKTPGYTGKNLISNPANLTVKLHLYTKPDEAGKTTMQDSEIRMWNAMNQYCCLQHQRYMEERMSQEEYYKTYMELEERRWFFNHRVLDNTSGINFSHTNWAPETRICPHVDRNDPNAQTCLIHTNGKSTCLVHWKTPKSKENAKHKWPETESTSKDHIKHENNWNISWRWRFLAISYTTRCLSEYITHSAVAQHLFDKFTVASTRDTFMSNHNRRVFPEPMLEIWNPAVRYEPPSP
tara:strand:+ start:981 stop:5921 length:4941 start_codon:yes stop_codon:yes gene_type:complete